MHYNWRINSDELNVDSRNHSIRCLFAFIFLITSMPPLRVSIENRLKSINSLINWIGTWTELNCDVSFCFGKQAPVKADLLFPCTEKSLGLQYNPLNVSGTDVKDSGTSDQYAMGDFSSKFGNLTGFKEVHTVFNDTNLPLYGATSVVGRSFVLNRARDNERQVYRPAKKHSVFK